MKKIVLVASVMLIGLPAALAEPSCQEQATTKKLAGAALKSFMTKCEKDAAATCEKASVEKKLAGAAKKSFETKCVKDAVGAKS